MENNLNLNQEEDSIKILEFPENVRKKFWLFLDSSDTCLREAVDNATDEVSECPTCNLVIIDNKNYGKDVNLVADNGRGLPITMSSFKSGITQAELALGYLNAGSKLDPSTATNTRSGTHGVGISSTNCLSEFFVAMSKITTENYDKSIPEVKTFYESLGPRSRKDIFYYISYSRGYKTGEGAARKKDLEAMLGLPKELPEGMSTMVLFKVDSEIFPNPSTQPPIENLQNFLFIQEKFYKRKNISIVVNGAPMVGSGFQTYKFEILKTITPNDPSANPYLGVFATFEVDNSLSPKQTDGCVNGLVCDGAQVTIVERCFEEALKAEYKINHRHIYPGLKLKVILLGESMVYDSQTKSRLKSISKVKQSDFSEITKEFQRIFRKNDDYWRPHVDKLNALAESYRSIGAVEKAQKMIDASKGNSSFRMKGQNYVEGFSDATTTDRWKAELFIVEGASAGGSLKAGRKNTLYHAVLPLRGKVLNVSGEKLEKILENKEIFTLFSTIGLGIDVNFVGMSCQTPEETYAEIQKHARFSRVILATDAD